MPEFHEIRANYDKDTIIVYQAYRKEVALPALRHQTFRRPFSLNRMTWIKPSFLWMMERCGWGLKSNQEYVLAIRITRRGWEEALSHAVLSAFEEKVYRDENDWRTQFESRIVTVQWDPERTMHGKSLQYKSIQVGLSTEIVKKYVYEWTVEIRDLTPDVKKIYALIQAGEIAEAEGLLPKEEVYSVEGAIAQRLGMSN